MVPWMTKERGEKGCTVAHRYVITALLMCVFLVSMGSGRSTFVLVMAYVTSAPETRAKNAVFPHCTTFNTTNDLTVPLGGDVVLLLHSAFYTGFALFRLPGAILAARLSQTRVLCACIVMISLSVLCLPFVLPLHNTPLLFCLRTLQGGLEGMYQPVIDGLIAGWSTPGEQSRLVSIAYTGMFLAPALALMVTGTTVCYVSWSTAFYIYGVAGLLLSGLVLMHVYDVPDQHPSLSHAERTHFSVHGTAVRSSSKQVFDNIPWKSMLTSVPVWTYIMVSFCLSAIFATLVTAEPQYFLDAYSMNSADIGLLASLPHVLLGVTCPLGGVLSDLLLRCGLPVTLVRKIMYTFGFGLEGLGLMALFWINEWQTALITLSLGTALGGIGMSGFLPIPMDMSPQYANILSGLRVTGALGGVVSTLCASVIVGKSRTLADWQFLYLVMGIIHLCGVLVFGLGASADRQPWAQGTDKTMHVKAGEVERNGKGLEKKVDGGDSDNESDVTSHLEDRGSETTALLGYHDNQCHDE